MTREVRGELKNDNMANDSLAMLSNWTRTVLVACWAEQEV